jgi:hypothetical protein
MRLMLPLLLAVACSSSLTATNRSPYEEGAGEYDPGRPSETGATTPTSQTASTPSKPTTAPTTTSEPTTTTPTVTTSTPTVTTTSPTVTTTSPTVTTTTGTAPLEACYPGADETWTTCLPVHTLTPIPAEYIYPPPLDGDPQYTAPTRYLDLDLEDPRLALAPNFVLEETAQAWKGRWGVVQGHAVARLQDLRDELGALVVNSGYRNPVYNEGVGGATWSRHQYGDAFDLDPASVSLDDLADACADHGAGYVGVYETHIHCDWRDDPLDPAFFDLDKRLAPPSRLPERSASIVPGLEGRLTAPAAGWDEGEPLRDWFAFDSTGQPLARQRSRTFVPPPGTAEVAVWVGLDLWVDGLVPFAP